MTPNNDAALARHNGTPPAVPRDPSLPFMPQNVGECIKLAETLSTSQMVPKGFQGKPQDILLLIIDALSRRRNPILHLRTRYVLHGQVGITSQGLIAEANSCGRFKGALKFVFDGQGDDLTATCWAIERETGEKLEYSFSMRDAKVAGFTSNKLYQQLPRQLLAYKAAAFFCRLFVPDIVQGLVTEDEAPLVASGHFGGPGSEETPILAEMNSRIAAVDAPPALELEPEYVPAATVAKLVKGFERVGYGLEYVAEKYGPLDAMTRETYDEAVKEGVERKREWEAAQRKRDEEPEAAASMYADDAEEVGYD